MLKARCDDIYYIYMKLINKVTKGVEKVNVKESKSTR